MTQHTDLMRMTLYSVLDPTTFGTVNGERYWPVARTITNAARMRGAIQ
jgi:hypothetical protein